MILPSSRLIFWTAAIGLPFSVLAATRPAVAAPSLAILGALALGALLDAWLSRHRLRGVRVEAPGLVRLARFQEGRIPLRIQPQAPIASLRLALGMPSEFAAASEDVRISLPEARAFQLDWRCTPGRRGKFMLRQAALETASRFGFWLVRHRVELASELRVYPDLRSERKRVAATFLHRGALGLHAWRQVGKGREFEKLREYLPGDSYEDIHWKATAKRRLPVTKIFQIERTQEVYVLVDAARLSARRAQGEEDAPGECAVNLLDRFITAALMVGYAADRQGDLFGLLTFSNKPEVFLKAGKGKSHFNACREALYTLEPRDATPDFAEVFAFVRTRLRKRALLMILTSLDDPLLAENFTRAVQLVSRHHLVLVNMMRPPEAAPLFLGPEPQLDDDLYRRLGGHHLWKKLDETGRQLQRQGVQFAQLENAGLSASLISQYMNMKQKQVL